MLLLFILNIYKWPYSYIQKPLTWLPIPTSITKILAEIVIIGLLSIATFALLHYFGTRIHLAKIDVWNSRHYPWRELGLLFRSVS